MNYLSFLVRQYWTQVPRMRTQLNLEKERRLVLEKERRLVLEKERRLVLEKAEQNWKILVHPYFQGHRQKFFQTFPSRLLHSFYPFSEVYKYVF